MIEYHRLFSFTHCDSKSPDRSNRDGNDNRNFKSGSGLRLLLAHGADINMQDTDGRTPLSSADWTALQEIHLRIRTNKIETLS
jgi:hypothetical protein